MTASVTFHHNFYNQCQSRLPFARQANMHMYNNYYYKSSGNNMQIYAGAYAFIENSYFEDVRRSFTISDRGIAQSAVKSYNNIYKNSPSDGATIVSSRNEVVDNQNVFNSTFDMDEHDFYYDGYYNSSDVSLMLETEMVKTYIPLVAGAGKLVSLNYSLHTIEENDPYVDSKVTATYTTNVPLTEGLYYQAIDANSLVKGESSIDNTTIVKSENGTIYVNDTSATLSTVGYDIFGSNNQASSGIITYEMDVTLTGVGSKWNFLRFLDTQGNEALAIRAASDTKYMAYTLNNDDSTEKVISSTAFSEGTYHVSLTINYSTSTATLSVGNKTVTISSFNKTISGIKFMTAIKATDRSFTIKNITITKE